MKTPNYHDFYQKALIPIGFNDRTELEKSDVAYSYSPATHWLIAVEGEQLPQAKIYFHWKVSIYPANSEGDLIGKTHIIVHRKWLVWMKLFAWQAQQ